MVEPLSIAASALGALDVGARVSTGILDIIRKWKNAPHEIVALHNEITDLRVVLDQMVYAYQILSDGLAYQDAGFVAAVHDHLEKALCYLKSLQTFSMELQHLKGARRWKRWLGSQNEVNSMRANLNIIRTELSQLFLAQNMFVSLHPGI